MKLRLLPESDESRNTEKSDKHGGDGGGVVSIRK